MTEGAYVCNLLRGRWIGDVHDIQAVGIDRRIGVGAHHRDDEAPPGQIHRPRDFRERRRLNVIQLKTADTRGYVGMSPIHRYPLGGTWIRNLDKWDRLTADELRERW